MSVDILPDGTIRLQKVAPKVGLEGVLAADSAPRVMF
jgi:hypothetical protein